MRYEKYEKRVATAGKIWKTIYRFRAPIIAVISAGAVTGATMFSIQGIPTALNIKKNQITYGEKFDIASSSFNQASEIEYRVKGEDTWTTDMPYFVGEYEVRGKAHNNFGGFYYSSVEPLTIVPKQVNVTLSSTNYTYGDKPNIKLDSLVGTDTLKEYEITYEDNDKLVTNAKTIEESIKIFNESNDVTYCYDFVSEFQNVSLKPRPISIYFPGGSKEYDRTPLSNDSYELTGTLAFKDQIVESSTKSPSITEGGEISSHRDVIIHNKDDQDVTSCYKITYIDELLKINKRKVDVYSLDYVRNYNGRKVTKNDLSKKQ